MVCLGTSIFSALWKRRNSLILTGAILLAYSNSFYCSFQYDDNGWLATHWEYSDGKELVTKGPSAILHFFDGTSNKNASRGLAMASFNLNYWLSGRDVRSYHAFNILMHLLSAYCVYALVRFLFRVHSSATPSQADTLSLLVALLFALSPVQAYAVTYITQRMEIMATFFILATTYFFIKGRYIFSLLAFILGCFCKEIAFITPAIIFLYMAVFGRVNLKPGLVCAILAGGLYLGLMQVSQNLHDCLWGSEPFTLEKNLDANGNVIICPGSKGTLALFNPVIVIDVLAEYVKLLAWPNPAQMCIDMEYLEIQNAVFLHLFSGLSICVIIGLVNTYIDRRLAIFCLGFLVLSMAIYSVMLPYLPDKIVLHRLYLACFPFYLFLVLSLYRFLGFGTAVSVLILLCTLFGLWTQKVNETFATELTAWKDATEKTRLKIRPIYNLAVTTDEENHKEYCIMKTILKERSRYVHRKRMFHFACVHREAGMERAEKLYGDTLIRMRARIDRPADVDLECIVKTYNNLGGIYAATGRFQAAIDCWKIFAWHPICRMNLEKTDKFLAQIEAKCNLQN